MKKKNEISIVRSSAAEYLTFLTATGQSDVNAVYADENVWLSQKMMGLLYNVESHTVTYHLQKAFKTGGPPGDSRLYRGDGAHGGRLRGRHGYPWQGRTGGEFFAGGSGAFSAKRGGGVPGGMPGAGGDFHSGPGPHDQSGPAF